MNEDDICIGMQAVFYLGTKLFNGFVVGVERKGKTVRWGKTLGQYDQVFTKRRCGDFYLQGKHYGKLCFSP